MPSPCAGCAEKRARKNGTTVVYTAGVFDMLHLGHLNLLRASKKWGDYLVVGVVSDAGTEAYKGQRPVQDEKTRLEVVRALGFVDLAILQDGTDPSANVTAIRPRYMTHGSDWERLQEGHETLEALGIEFVRLPYTSGISSTELRERL
jgi:rfaE bifunctional protein nucleotidyltransferase chain/domain